MLSLVDGCMKKVGRAKVCKLTAGLSHFYLHRGVLKKLHMPETSISPKIAAIPPGIAFLLPVLLNGDKGKGLSPLGVKGLTSHHVRRHHEVQPATLPIKGSGLLLRGHRSEFLIAQ